VTWEGPYSFDPSTDYKIDVRSTGRLHSYRITSSNNVAWAVSGIGFEIEPAGKR
jgi:hypothetical protein